MSEIRANTIKGEDGIAAVQFPTGQVVTGVSTATSFSGSGDVTVTGSVTAATGTFSGNVSVGGALTYENVTNVDAVGIVTARQGIRVGAGKSIGSDSGTVSYFGDGSNLTGIGGGGKVKGWSYGTTPSGTTSGATSSNKITLFTQAYTPTAADSTILILNWINIDARTSTYSDQIRIQGQRDNNAQGARWLIHGNFGNSGGSIFNLPYVWKPTGWTAGSSSTFKVELWSEGCSGSPSDQYNTRLHEGGYYLLLELGA